MHKQILLLISLLTFINLNAQTDEQVVNELLFDLFGSQQDTILIKRLKTKTHLEYDSVSFSNMTGLTIPSQIISDQNNNEESVDYSTVWNELNLNKMDTLIIGNDTVMCKKPIFKCLTKVEIDILFEQTRKRKDIYTISKILFDDSRETAIFHFTITPWPGDLIFETILIKKVFKKWKIIERFDYMMS